VFTRRAAVAISAIAASASAVAPRTATVPVAHDVAAARDSLGLLEHGLAGKVDPALLVDLGHLDVDLVAQVDRVLDPAHPLLGQLADVDQPIGVGHDLDEGAEGHDPDHLAAVGLTHLDLTGDLLDDLLRLGRGVGIERADDDPAVVLD